MIESEDEVFMTFKELEEKYSTVSLIKDQTEDRQPSKVSVDLGQNWTMRSFCI